MGGYLKRGKETDNFLKLYAKLEFLGNAEKKKEEELKLKEFEKEKGKKKAKQDNGDDLEDIIKKEQKSMDFFNKTYLNFMTNCYFNKLEKRNLKKELIPIPFANIKVRVYILRCLNLTAQDDSSSILVKMAGMSAFSKANSYLEIIIGEGESNDAKLVKYVNDRQNFVVNSLSPDFFTFFELDAEFPHDWKLTINVKSRNEAGSDSLIGTTIIDLEDRYLGEYRTRELLKLKALEQQYTEILNKKDEDNPLEINEKEIKDKLTIINRKTDELKEYQVPVEYRPLRHPGKKTAQGIVEMFVEVLPQARAKYIKPAKIEPPPPENYELRLVIWETRNVFLERKKQVDCFINVSYDPEGWLGSPTKKSTDTHLGCEDGNAKFNWRMKFNIRIPCTFPRLYFTVFDFNTIASDEAIGECYISLRRVLKRLLQEGKLSIEKKKNGFL